MVLSTPVISKTRARLPREFSTVDRLDRACTGHQRDWRSTSPGQKCNRVQACSHGVLLPRAMQKECVRMCCRTPLPFPFQHSKMLFVPVKFIGVFSDTQSIYNHIAADHTFLNEKYMVEFLYCTHHERLYDAIEHRWIPFLRGECVLSRQSIQSVAISTSGITSVMSASGSVSAALGGSWSEHWRVCLRIS
jgi:hypothetical protein